MFFFALHLYFSVFMYKCAFILHFKNYRAVYRCPLKMDLGQLTLLAFLSGGKRRSLLSAAVAPLPCFCNTQLPIRYSGLTDKGERVTQHGIPNKRMRRGGMSAGYSRV